MIEDVGYLDASIASRSSRGRSTRSARSTAPAAGGRRHQPVRRRARLLHRGVRRGRRIARIDARARGGRRAHRRVLLLSASPGRPRGRVRAACDCRKPGARHDRSGRARSRRSIRRARSWSATLARRRRWRAPVGARGILVRTGDGAAEEARPPERVSPPTRWWTIWRRRRAGFCRNLKSRNLKSEF